MPRVATAGRKVAVGCKHGINHIKRSIGVELVKLGGSDFDSTRKLRTDITELTAVFIIVINVAFAGIGHEIVKIIFINADTDAVMLIPGGKAVFGDTGYFNHRAVIKNSRLQISLVLPMISDRNGKLSAAAVDFVIDKLAVIGAACVG